MLTENRSSNTEMVSVPRALVEATIGTAVDFDRDGSVAALQEWLNKPAQQHQDEPVGYVRPSNLRNLRLVAYCAAIEITGVPQREGDVPLYTHADPAEVERLRAELENATDMGGKAINRAGVLARDNDTLRAQLAEAQALLRDWLDADPGKSSPAINDLRRKTDYLLSASAEPSAPVMNEAQP